MARQRAMRTVVVGLTGGVGAGKSTVEHLLALRGVPTADADRWAHEVLAADTVARQRIAAYFRRRFGVDVRRADGSIDRGAVAARVFADADALRFVEGVVHPRVKRRAAAWCAAQRRLGVPVAMMVVPLLVESGMDKDVDCVVALKVPAKERCRRLMAARGWTEREARARMRRQLSDAARARRADYVIGNAGTPAQLAAAIGALHDKLRLRAARGAGKHTSKR